MECLHCNKTPMCVQVPGDLLTCTQHWQSAARVRCVWWWWHHHFWQLFPMSVEWGNVPQIKTDSGINNDRSLCFKLVFYFFHWGLPEDHHDIHPAFQPPVGVTRDTGSVIEQVGYFSMVSPCEGAGCIFNGRWACSMPPDPLPTCSSGSTSGNKSQGGVCQQLGERALVPGCSWGLNASERVLLQLLR